MTYHTALLAKLLALKGLLLFLAALVSGVVWSYFSLDLPWLAIITVLAVGLLALGLWTFRLRFGFPATELEVFLLLLSDVLILFFLVDLSGGSTNPFTSSLLIPLALAAAFLSKRFSVLVLLLALAMNAWWTFSGDLAGEFSAHDEHAAHRGHSAFSLHLFGMWINFLLSALLLYVFIIYAMESARSREKQLQQARERILRDEQVVAVAALTANTAHALGTPLSTMAIIIESWENEGELNEEEQLLKTQVAICKKHLAEIRRTNADENQHPREAKSVAALLDALKQHCQLAMPGSAIHFVADETVQKKNLLQNRSLQLAIFNLIENAVQSGASLVEVEFSEQSNTVEIAVLDNGRGIDNKIVGLLGKAFVSTRDEGLGLGFYLSNSTIEQFGGNIRLARRSEGGTRTVISLPMLA